MKQRKTKNKYGRYLLIVNGISILCSLIIWLIIFILDNGLKVNFEYDFLYVLGCIFPGGIVGSPIIAGIIYCLNNNKITKQKKKV